MFRRLIWLTPLYLLIVISMVVAQEQSPAIETLINEGPPEECDFLAVGWLCIVTPGTVVDGYGAFTYNDENQDLGYTLPLYETDLVVGAEATADSEEWGMILAHLPLIEAEPESVYRSSNPFANMIISGTFTLNNVMMVQPELLTSITLETGTSALSSDDNLLDGMILTVPQESEVDLRLAVNDVNLVIPPNGVLFLTAPPDAAMTIRALREDVTINDNTLAEGMTTTVVTGELTDTSEASEPFTFIALDALQPLRRVEPLDAAASDITVTPDTFGVGSVFDAIEADDVVAMSIANNESGAVFAVTRTGGGEWMLADGATVEVDVSVAQDILNQTLDTLLALEHRSTFDTPFPDIFGLDPSFYIITLQTAAGEQQILHTGDLTPGAGDARYVAFDEDLMSVLVVAAVETFDDDIFPLVDDPQMALMGG